MKLMNFIDILKKDYRVKNLCMAKTIDLIKIYNFCLKLFGMILTEYKGKLFITAV
jgi:hypothetical protein